VRVCAAVAISNSVTNIVSNFCHCIPWIQWWMRRNHVYGSEKRCSMWKSFTAAEELRIARGRFPVQPAGM
jgi:hypothetical protein